MNRLPSRDEREASVDAAADRLSFSVIAFGLLAIVAYRSFALGEASWELLGLVILAGAVGTLYRTWRGVVSRAWIIAMAVTAAAGAIVATVLVLLQAS